MNVRERLVNLLRGLAPVQRLANGRVFHKQVPAALDQYPCLVYARTGGSSIKDLQGGAGLNRARFQVDCYALRPSEVSDLADAVMTLEGQHDPAATGIQWIWHEDEADDLDPPQEGQELGIERVTVELTVWY